MEKREPVRREPGRWSLLCRQAAHGYLDLAGDRVGLLAGAGRSGTTWVANIVRGRGDVRLLFEPFWGKTVPAFSHFHRRQYLRSGERGKKFVAPVRRVLEGRLVNAWTDKLTGHGIFRCRLIKDIRANLFLFWLHETFPDVPIVFLVRHPCAVAVSQLNMGWNKPVSDLLAQRDLVDDFLAPYETLIRDTRNPFENRILLWCVEHLVPFRQFRPDQLCVLFYEDLVSDPWPNLDRLFTALGCRVPKDAAAHLAAPSSLCRKGSAILEGKDLLTSWRTEVSAAQEQRTHALLKAFGLAGLYDENGKPCPGVLADVLRSG